MLKSEVIFALEEALKQLQNMDEASNAMFSAGRSDVVIHIANNLYIKAFYFGTPWQLMQEQKLHGK